MKLDDFYPSAFLVPDLPRLPSRTEKVQDKIAQVGDTFLDSVGPIPPYRPPKKRRKKKASTPVTKPSLAMPDEKKPPQHRFSLFKDNSKNSPKKKPKAQTSRLRVR